MNYLAVLSANLERNTIDVFAINQKVVNYQISQGRVYILPIDDIMMNTGRDRNVIFLGSIEPKNEFVISDEYISLNIQNKEILNSIQTYVSLSDTGHIASTNYEIVNISVIKKKKIAAYSVGYSLENNMLVLYSVPPSNTTFLQRLMSKNSVSTSINNAVCKLALPTNKLFDDSNVSGDILNYIEDSANIDYGLEYLNIILLRHIFASSRIPTPLKLCEKALQQKSHFLNVSDINILADEKYILLFSYSHSLKDIKFYVVEESLIHKVNSKYTFGFVDEGDFHRFATSLSSSNKNKIFKFTLDRDLTNRFTEETIEKFLTHKFKNEIRIHLNTTVKKLSVLINEIDCKLSNIKGQYLSNIHSSSLFFEEVVIEKMKENKRVCNIFYLE